MKKLNVFFKKYFLLSSLLVVFAFPSFAIANVNYPSPTNYKYVNDYVGILNQSELETLVSLGKELEDKTGAQSIVVIINTVNDLPIETYAINLFRSWGIGEKSKDNGLLMLVAIDDRNWRIEVGRGLEGAIPDALSNRIMDSLAKSHFKDGNYASGIVNSYSAFNDLIAEEYGVKLDKSLNISLPDNYKSQDSNNFFDILPMGILLLLSILDVIFNKGRVIKTIFKILFWSSFFGGRGGPGTGGFGGGSKSNNSGGFGGFGGGSSNGGGSSGRW